MATTPRTAPSKARTATAPKPKVMFDIAVAEKEFGETDRPEPFTVRLKSGKVITFVDPELVDYLELAAVDESRPAQAFRAIVEESGAEDLFAEKIPTGVVRQLIGAWKAHYAAEIGLDEGESVG